MVAESVIESGLNPTRFQSCLARRLRWWLARIPAGIGLATLRSIVKLWLGFGPQHSGVNSAGNGPAMRSAIIGAALPNSAELRRELVRASTRLTHTDARAEQGATIVAEAAALAARTQASGSRLDIRQCTEALLPFAQDADLASRLRTALDFAAQARTPAEFAGAMGFSQGVSGYVNHTVPAAVFCWLRYAGDFRSAVESAVLLGGDSDTVGAITGALAGTALGPDSIPPEWRNGLCDWPLSVAQLLELSAGLAGTVESQKPGQVRRFLWPAVLARNVLFALIVLTHGLRRLLPPW